MNIDANLAQLVALVFGLTAALRTEWPALDGRAVYGVALVLGELVAFLTATDIHAVRSVVWQGLQVGAGAVAAASGGSYLAGKIGTAIAPATKGSAV